MRKYKAGGTCCSSRNISFCQRACIDACDGGCIVQAVDCDSHHHDHAVSCSDHDTVGVRRACHDFSICQNHGVAVSIMHMCGSIMLTYLHLFWAVVIDKDDAQAENKC